MIVCAEGVCQSKETKGDAGKQDRHYQADLFVRKPASPDLEGVFHGELGFNKMEGRTAGRLDFRRIRGGKFFPGPFPSDADSGICLQIFDICIDGGTVLFCQMISGRYLDFLSVVGKGRCFFCGRCRIYLHVADYPAVRQLNNTVCIIFCKLPVVGHNDDKLFLRQFFERFQHLTSCIGVQCAGRFVRHDDFRLFNQRAGNCYPLLLAAGKGHRVSVFEAD